MILGGGIFLSSFLRGTQKAIDKVFGKDIWVLERISASIIIGCICGIEGVFTSFLLFRSGFIRHECISCDWARFVEGFNGHSQPVPPHICAWGFFIGAVVGLIISLVVGIIVFRGGLKSDKKGLIFIIFVAVIFGGNLGAIAGLLGGVIGLVICSVLASAPYSLAILFSPVSRRILMHPIIGIGILLLYIYSRLISYSEVGLVVSGGIYGGISGTIVARIFNGRILDMIFRGITAPGHLLSIPVAQLLILSSNRKVIHDIRCLRYTVPLKSKYSWGTRFCEHCGRPVEHTREPGMVIFIFGNYKVEQGNRRFILTNLDFEGVKEPIDVKRVYIDTTTCNKLLVEKFMVYIVNNPPRDGLGSMRILYRGNLSDLDYLKNTIVNNFKRVTRIYS